MSSRRRTEVNKRAGVYYACTQDGVELPLIDVTHPSFALSVGADELKQRLQQFLDEQAQLSKLPYLLREPLLRIVLRGSVLVRGLRAAKGSYLAGVEWLELVCRKPSQTLG